MLKRDVRNTGDALAYLLDCTLATIEHYMTLKRPPAGECKRQIGIAQHGLDWCRRFDVDLSSTRARDIGESVGEWYNNGRSEWEKTVGF